ncbi:zinc ribbon domain-containing protein YjdM [Bartonella sp. DGB2]|uniref:zinc ribbon domain-containing protein YjdM n=1 Tax=Bartonella sp. DGB2 TaxID=3388426 RepID=UPI00398FC338
MSDFPPCPICASPYSYEDGGLFLCPECGHAWHGANEDSDAAGVFTVCDAHGTLLQDGDTVILIKDLKVKGSASTLKVGTKVKNIRLVEGDHNIDCKIVGVGSMGLKAEFVKKA